MKSAESYSSCFEELSNQEITSIEGGFLIHSFLYMLTALDIIGKINNEDTTYPITIVLPRNNVITIDNK